jgi:IrrE N-terminal-like domain
VLAGREPVPLEVPREPLEGESHAGLLEALERLAGELGYEVRYRPLDGPDGVCDYRRRRISIDEALAANARVATLVHELGHVLVKSEPAGDDGLTKGLEELVVEAVVYVAFAAAGLDTGRDSVPYIASWEGENALEQLQRTAELIDALARRIERAIDAGRESAAA